MLRQAGSIFVDEKLVALIGWFDRSSPTILWSTKQPCTYSKSLLERSFWRILFVLILLNDFLI